MGHKPKCKSKAIDSRRKHKRKSLLGQDYFVLGKDLDMISKTQYIKEKN